MKSTNVEIKARTSIKDEIKQVLHQFNAEFHGIDYQTDIYFNVRDGRLKLRKGKIENYLIHYTRPNQEGPKSSKIILYKSNVDSELEEILRSSLGVKVEVRKTREIYFIKNVKFHLDNVEGLGGDFVEIEAIDSKGDIGEKKLMEQCILYLNLFQIAKKDLINCSYSDLILRRKRDE